MFHPIFQALPFPPYPMLFWHANRARNIRSHGSSAWSPQIDAVLAVKEVAAVLLSVGARVRVIAKATGGHQMKWCTVWWLRSAVKRLLGSPGVTGGGVGDVASVGVLCRGVWYIRPRLSPPLSILNGEFKSALQVDRTAGGV